MLESRSVFRIAPAAGPRRACHMPVSWVSISFLIVSAEIVCDFSLSSSTMSSSSTCHTSPPQIGKQNHSQTASYWAGHSGYPPGKDGTAQNNPLLFSISNCGVAVACPHVSCANSVVGLTAHGAGKLHCTGRDCQRAVVQCSLGSAFLDPSADGSKNFGPSAKSSESSGIGTSLPDSGHSREKS